MDLNPIDYVYGAYGGAKQLLEMRKNVKNWYTVMLFYSGLIHSFDLEPRGRNEKVRIRNYEDYKRFWERESMAYVLRKVSVSKNQIRFPYKSRILKFYYDDDAQFIDTMTLIGEQFLQDGYGQLDAKGSTVIDIGANIGDTAIYFALNGARHVYAFEPYPYPYAIARRNIRDNGLNDKVTLMNVGSGARDSHISIKGSLKSKSYTLIKDMLASKGGKRIKMLSLDTIAKRYCDGEAVLKIDTEGGEYDIILNASTDTLRKFKQIMIEYHDGYSDLKKKLEDAGFSVQNGARTISYNYRLFGMIFASRKTAE